MAGRAEGAAGQRHARSRSTAGLSWQPSQPCAGLSAAEEQHTLILRCLAMDLPQCSNPRPGKAPCPGPALGQPGPARPGLATRSAERAGRRRRARKARWATESIVMARKLNCNAIRTQENYFSSFLTGHTRCCLCLVEFQSVLQGAGQAGGCIARPSLSQPMLLPARSPGVLQLWLGSQAATPGGWG